MTTAACGACDERLSKLNGRRGKVKDGTNVFPNQNKLYNWRCWWFFGDHGGDGACDERRSTGRRTKKSMKAVKGILTVNDNFHCE